MAVLGIGVDAVDVARMKRVLDRGERGRRFLLRVFDEEERSLCSARVRPDQCYAARFAAKEAMLKALGAEGIAFAFGDVAVRRDASGAPSLAVRGRVAERCRERGVARMHLTLTHTDAVAVAMVVLED